MMKSAGLTWALSGNDYEQYKMERGNSTTDLSIPFTIEDIKYLIVRDIRNVKHYREKLEGVPIFTQRQVKQDFIGTNHSFGVRSFDTLFDSGEEFGQSFSTAGGEAVMGTFPKGEFIES